MSGGLEVLMSKSGCSVLTRNSRFAVRALVVFVLIATSGCRVNSSTIELEILNMDDYAITGDLEIMACAKQEINTSELGVYIYVTENEEWGRTENLLGYEHYINPDFVSVPGVLGNPIPEDYWQRRADGCYTAVIENVFVETTDWLECGLCPFQAIVVVAAYQRGAANEAEIVECDVPGR